MSSSTIDHADGAEVGGESHLVHAGDVMYIKVALALAVLTGIEVATYFFDFQGLFVPVLVGLMIVKFFTVVWFFMHLKFDSTLFRRIFFSGLVLAIGVYTVALTTFQFWSGS